MTECPRQNEAEIYALKTLGKNTPFVLQKLSILPALLRTCLLVSRTAESSSKETQKDVHCENGRDEEPVEEYCRALRQLVSICHMCCVAN